MKVNRRNDGKKVVELEGCQHGKKDDHTDILGSAEGCSIPYGSDPSALI
ncbi:hypothetical protein [Methanomethylovorans sp.]